MNSINTKKTLIATCLIGSLLGLGLLLHYHYQQNQLSENPDKGETPERPSEKAQKRQALPKKRESSKKPQQEKAPPFYSITPTFKTNIKADVVENKYSSVPLGDDFPLRLGSKGRRVERLRIWLMRNYGWTGIITDEFDKQTERLLKRYLKKTQLDETTYKKLRMGQDLYKKS